MQFTYTAVDKTGKKEEGKIDANQEKDVLDFLRNKELIPLKVEKKTKSEFSNFVQFKKIGPGDTVMFTRQLSSMIVSGLTIIESLTILKQQAVKPQMQKVIEDLIENVSEGKSFAQALETHKEVFSPVYISLIKAAEAGGILDKILLKLADNLERNENIKRSIRSALFYPGIIVAGVLGIIIIMNVFVIPQLNSLYTNLGLALPLSTRIVIGISTAFTKFYFLVIPAIIIAVILFIRFKKTESGRVRLDKLKLKIPLAGEIFRLAILEQTTRTLSLLVSSGTSIIDSLTITANVAGNHEYKLAYDTSARLVEKGITLSTAFENQKIFPPIVIQMAKVGESTGKIDENLLKSSEYFERDLNIKLKTLTASIEPILIIFLGAIVAFLIISVITPIYSLITQLQ